MWYRHLRILDNTVDHPAMTHSSALTVAFATTDRKQVNQHFGSAQAFVIYALSAEQATLVEIAQFGDAAQDGHEDKLASKLELLEGCSAVYCQAVGGSAIRQLLGIGVQPIKVAEGTLIENVLEDLQQQLQSANPVAWLMKAMKRQQIQAEASHTDRFAAMEAEGWRE